jgi:hypothetical protein
MIVTACRSAARFNAWTSRPPNMIVPSVGTARSKASASVLFPLPVLPTSSVHVSA